MRNYKTIYVGTAIAIVLLLVVMMALESRLNKSHDAKLIIEFDQSVRGQAEKIASYIILQDGISHNTKNDLQFGVRDDKNKIVISIRINEEDNSVRVMETALRSIKSAGLNDKLVKIEWNK